MRLVSVVLKVLLIPIMILTGAATLVAPRAALARTSFDTIGFKPADDFGPYLVVQGTQTLGRKGFSLGLSAEFSNDSLVLENAAGVRIRDVINEQLVWNLGGAFGVTDWLNLGLLATVVPFQRFETAPGVSDNGFRMGDIRIDAKARVVDNRTHPVGFAVVPFLTVPTGNSTHFIGNGNVTGGAVLSLESKRLWDRFSAALNLGSQFRKQVALSPGTNVASQFLYGLGLNVAVAKPVELMAELTGWTPWAHFFESANRNLELNAGARFLPTERVALTVGGGTGILDGAGAPSYRVFLMAAYRRPREEAPPPAPPPPAPEPVKEEVISTNRIHFAFNKAVIRPESYPVIDEILAGIQGRSEVESVRVEGHTDSVGSDAYNKKLSDQRAGAVRTYLIGKGYPADKVTAEGVGEASPIADNATKSGRAQNRRVEFHLQLQPGAKVKVEKKSKEESPTYQEGDPVPEGTEGGRGRGR